ncbi:MAG: M15 family metallopeptidase, partial [Spirochaetales bacterium]|nr:M15 family metallopeptidase [Spirochaetales bacterium]
LLLLIILLSSCAEEPVQALHPDFSLNLEELTKMTIELPEQIKSAIAAEPGIFLDLASTVLGIPLDLLLIADKTHSLAPDFVPPDLVDLSDYPIVTGRNGLLLREIVMPDLLAMNEAAKNDSITLVFSSTYRSYDYQKGVYERAVAREGKEQADRESAQPGKSQHQLGTTIDFGSITDEFGDTPAGRWLAEHAWEYGFSLSYPEGYESVTGYRHEIWHYRYISRPAAALERRYFDSLQHYFLEFIDANRSDIEKTRKPNAVNADE